MGIGSYCYKYAKEANIYAYALLAFQTSLARLRTGTTLIDESKGEQL